MAAIVENTKELSTRPGFVGAAVHRSAIGTRVLNYVQWRSREEFEAMRSESVAAQRTRAAGALAEGAEPQFRDDRLMENEALEDRVPRRWHACAARSYLQRFFVAHGRVHVHLRRDRVEP